MMFCRCSRGGREFFGIADSETVRELSASFLGNYEETGTVYPLSELAFLPPVIPGTFYAAGFNYGAHLQDHADLGYTPVQLADHPEVGYRANNALTGHGTAIIKPAGVQGRFEAEGEVVAVIGSTLRHATREEAKAGIFGWTIGNDVSAREWQHADRTFYRSKNADTFKPMGPWIVTGIDPMESTTTVSVNGEVVSTFDTGAMIFDPYDFIAEITKYSTMHPGDVLWMGAQGASGIDAGDDVDISVSGIGTLSNHVVKPATSNEQKAVKP